MAASGPWNNLLTWIVLTLIASTRLWTFVYHDYSDQGRVVLDINFVSTKARRLPPTRNADRGTRDNLAFRVIRSYPRGIDRRVPR